MESKPSRSQRRIACLLLEGARPESQKHLIALAESCFRFTPQVALRETSGADPAVFLDITGTSNLYTESGLSLRLTTLAARFGWRGRVAFSETAVSALLMTKYPMAGVWSATELPLEAMIDIAAPFRPNSDDPDQARKLREMVEALKLLGIRKMGDFAALPPAGLASRFGKNAVEVLTRVWGDRDVAWPGFHPKPKIVESAAFENMESQGSQDLSSALESVIFVLKGLVDRAMARLRGRHERASVVRVGLELEKWSTVKNSKPSWKVELPIAQGSAGGLLPILQEHLSHSLGREPLGSPIQKVELRVLETVPGRASQRDFFSKKEEDAEAREALVGRLAQKLGKPGIFTAVPVERYLPEGAWKRGDPQSEKITEVRWPERPTRLLGKPEPLERDGEMLIHLTGKRWVVEQWEGPERLSGEWWEQAGEGFARDYYRVRTRGGELLWVFLNRKAKVPTFYLHGYFD